MTTPLILLVLLLTLIPSDGGNHQRKEVGQPVSAVYKFHPPKELDL